MKNSKYRNRKYVLQRLCMKGFIWDDVFSATDDKDLLASLLVYNKTLDEGRQFRLIEITKTDEIVNRFFHNKNDFTLFIEELKQSFNQKQNNNKIGFSLVRDSIPKKCKKIKRVLNSIDCEVFTNLRRKTEEDEQEIIRLVKKNVGSSYEVNDCDKMYYSRSNS